MKNILRREITTERKFNIVISGEDEGVKVGIFLKKNSQRLGRRFVGPDGLRKRRPFSFQKGRWL